jgi:hypothetical protein
MGTRAVSSVPLEALMRTWIIPVLGLLCGGCSLPATGGDSPVPLTWKGDFNRGTSTAGHITLLFDEVGASVSGTMFYETAETDGTTSRGTYRIEGTTEDGAIRFEQKEILEADPLGGGRTWCLGSYDLSLGDPTESSERAEATSAPGLSGAYSSGSGCAGTTALLPAETL